MRSCESVRAQLKAYLDGECGLLARGRVRAHLASCTDCRAEAEALRRIGEVLRAAPQAEPAPALRSRILDALPEMPERRPVVRRPVRWAPVGALAGGLAALALAVGFFWQPITRSASPTASMERAAQREQLALGKLATPGGFVAPMSPPEARRSTPPPLFGANPQRAMMESAHPGIAPMPPRALGMGVRPLEPTTPSSSVATTGRAYGGAGAASAPASAGLVAGSGAPSAATRPIDGSAVLKDRRTDPGEAAGDRAGSPAPRIALGATPREAGGRVQATPTADKVAAADAVSKVDSMTTGLSGRYTNGASGAPPMRETQASFAPNGVPDSYGAETNRNRLLEAQSRSAQTNNAMSELQIDMRVERLDSAVSQIRERVREAGGSVRRRHRDWQRDGSRVVTLTVELPSEHAAAIRALVTRLGAPARNRDQGNEYQQAPNLSAARRLQSVGKDKPAQTSQAAQAPAARNSQAPTLQYQNTFALKQNATNAGTANQAQTPPRAVAESTVTLTIILRGK